MCGITGWIDFKDDLTLYPSILESMTETLAPRGPDATGIWLSTHCAFGHRRLSVIDPENGAQPMRRKVNEQNYVIVYNGELYNASELRQELLSRGYSFRTHCDTEVLLISYIEWGKGCVERLNGIFAFAVWCEKDEALFAARDRVGVKPFFFSDLGNGTLLFGSEPKAILQHPSVRAEVDKDGLAEIFMIGPARTPGHAVYKQMSELKPGCFMTFDRNGRRTHNYWKLESAEHPDDLEKTAVKVRELLTDTVERQLVSDVPVCSLLSGGLDSSALTAIAMQYYSSSNQSAMHTYSVDYTDNDKYFKANVFQPNTDAPWIQRMSEHLGTEHHSIQFDTDELINALNPSMLARDMPGMADIDASLLLFCKEIKKGATVAISGEAADEIFGGYPWFHREESLQASTFPWSLATAERINLLSRDITDLIQPEAYVMKRYQEALDEVPRLQGEDAKKTRMREIAYINITRFMPTLLDRKDRMSMAAGLEVRVPFCDHRLIEYVWNIPWEMKSTGGREKGILRKALKGLLPDDVLERKKSPYPKTHNPAYLAAVRERIMEILHDPASPLLPLINTEFVKQLAAATPETLHFPWFGQLMNVPQLFAFLGTVDAWMRQYKISIV